MDVRTTGGHILAMGPGIASPPDHSHHDAAAVAMDSHRPGCGGEVQVPRGPVALTPVEEADFRALGIQKRDIDPHIAPVVG